MRPQLAFKDFCSIFKSFAKKKRTTITLKKPLCFIPFMSYSRLCFATAGIPLSAKPGIISGIERLKELGLDGMEIEFVRGVRMSDELAHQVRATAKALGKELTAHAPYYINLNSAGKEKQKASEERILQTARKLHLCGGRSATFHAAYYMKASKEAAYAKVKDSLKRITKILQDEGNKVEIRPELTGKPTQWGDIDELIRLSQELEQVLPCIDFAHNHARLKGKFNTYEEFSELFRKLEAGLGKEILSNMHMHLAGINYSEKGERNHLNLQESDLNYKGLMKALKDFKIKGMLVSESPNIEGDSILAKKTYNEV